MRKEDNVKKLITTLVFITAAYALPLIGSPDLIIDWRIVTLMLAGAVMLLTQPAFNFKDASAHKDDDRSSVILILGAGVVCQILPVLEWAYVRQLSEGTPNVVAITIGLSMLIGGLAFRIWSIRTLGKFFTATVQRVEGHRVIKHGPYAIVRHPSYLGATVAMVGTSVLLGAWVAGVVSLIMLTAAYAYRIAAEERLLTQEFGEEYSVYRTGTPGLIPGSSCRQWARVAAALSRQLEKSTPMLD